MVILKRFFLQWTLLTRIPVPRAWVYENFNDAMSLIYAPLVGVVLGGFCGVIGMIISREIIPIVAAWITMGAYVISGWSLHLDGVADLADGFASGKKGEAFRAVMKDSHIGAFGVMALVLVLGLWALPLSVIDTKMWPLALAISGGCGRLSMCVAAWRGEYPWASGMGKVFVSDFDTKKMLCALPMALIIFLLSPRYATLPLLGSLAVGFFTAMWAQKNIGGVNGDVLGTTEVKSEIFSLLSFMWLMS